MRNSTRQITRPDPAQGPRLEAGGDLRSGKRSTPSTVRTAAGSKVRRAGAAIAHVCRGMTYDEVRAAGREARRILGLRRPKARRRVVDRLTRPELDKLLEHAYRSHRGPLLKTLFLTGCRVSEFVGLDVEDFSYDDKTITIRQGKGRKDRIVPILPALADELAGYIGREYRNTGPIFRTREGRRFSQRRVQQIVQELAAEACIAKRVYPHLMRHTVAQHLYEGGMPLEQVQRFLGHARITTTQIYAESSAAMIRESYRKALRNGADGQG